MRKKKRILGILLSLALMLGLMPGMSLTAYAATAYRSGRVRISDVAVNDIISKDCELYKNNNFALEIYDTDGTTLLKSYGSSGFNSNVQPGYYTIVVQAGRTVKIKKLSEEPAVTSVTLDKDTLSLTVGGETATLTASVTANYDTVKTVNWSSSDTSVATVNNGVITPVGAGGPVTIKATSTWDNTKYAECVVTVNAAHTHIFTYSPGGATITATCGADGCTLPVVEGKPTATLTIAASGGTYDGTTAYGATITDTYSIQGEAKVQYQKKSGGSYGTATETAPTDAGEYKASITVGGATASVEYAIAPMALTIDTATATNRTYDKDNTAVTISAVTFKDSSSNPVALTLTTDYTVTGAMTDANAGDNKEVTATVTLSNGNYSLATNTATTTVNIGKADAQTIADVTDTLLYTATSVSEAVAGKMPDDAGTLTYSKGTATTTGSVTVSNFDVNATSGAVTATLSGGAVGDTATLPVTIGSTNYADSTVNVKITLTAKGTQTITAADMTVSYGDTGKSVSASVTDPASGGGAISYAVKDGSGDYIDVDATTGALTIKKVPPTDGKAFVTVTAAETDTYAQATKEVTVTISPKAMTVSASGYTGDYDEQPHGITVTVTDPASSATVKYGTVEGTYDLDASPTQTEVGSKTVYYQVTAENYTTNTGSATVTINPKGSSGTPGEKTLVYNSTAQKLVTAGKAEGGIMQYALGEDATTAPTEGWGEEVPTGVDAKTYFVWYMVKGDPNHKDTDPACVEATIAKKGLTVTADAKSKTQGEADPALTYTAEGLVGNDTLTGVLSRDAGEDPGTYAITQGTLTAGDNYVITFVPATLTINKAPAPDPGPAPAPAPAPAPSSGGGGGYYGGGTVQNQRRDAYSDVIGAAATNFWDSSPERIHNIELACEKLDGIVLQPGEVFSFNDVIGARTAEAGFEIAPVNPDDAATAEMGGGVSQVASTLYTGSLFALLETVERTNHPYAVPFIQPGTDAYVANADNGSGPDLKFRNTRGEPIRISAKTRVDEARQVREIVIELQSALGSSDYMPIRFDNTWGGDQNAFLTETPYDLTRPGYRILLTHEEQAFTDNQGAGIRTLTHRKILDAAGMLVRDEILNQRLSGDSYAMDTYYTKG